MGGELLRNAPMIAAQLLGTTASTPKRLITP